MFKKEIEVAMLELTTTPMSRMLHVIDGTAPIGWTDEEFLSAIATRGRVL